MVRSWKSPSKHDVFVLEDATAIKSDLTETGMSIEPNMRSDVGEILQTSPRLVRSYGRVLGAVLTWKALTAVQRRNLLGGALVSILSAAATFLLAMSS